MKASKTKKAATSSAISVPGVDLVQVERVLEFMAAHNLEEFEYSHGGLHIRLKRSLAGRGPGAVAIPAEAPVEAPPVASGSVAVPAATPESAAKPAPAKEELYIIKSPIVGTFYTSPSPEAPLFVKVGDSIQSGQVVCIVEAMKLMNEIEADMGGEIVGVLAENGQPVEYGQSLFALRPAKRKK
jgi:acetyl-CoA carboxylase biotin carboxyl carrier protein